MAQPRDRMLLSSSDARVGCHGPPPSPPAHFDGQWRALAWRSLADGLRDAAALRHLRRAAAVRRAALARWASRCGRDVPYAIARRAVLRRRTVRAVRAWAAAATARKALRRLSKLARVRSEQARRREATERWRRNARSERRERAALLEREAERGQWERRASGGATRRHGVYRSTSGSMAVFGDTRQGLIPV